MMILNRVVPSKVAAGVVVPQTLSVDFEKYIGAKTNFTGDGDEMLYIVTANNINTETTVGQQWGQDFAKQSYTLGQIGIPLYKISAYVEYSYDEQAKFDELTRGVGLANFLRSLAEQAINQRRHAAILYGFDFSLNQGILGNATEANLPNDSAGVSTITKYDLVELQRELLFNAREVMQASYGIARPTVMATSPRIMTYLQSNVVPLLQSQKDGGGVDSVAGLYGRILGQWLGIGEISLVTDPLLEDPAGDGFDTIAFIAPGIFQQGTSENGENIAGGLNSISYNTTYDTGMGLKKQVRPDDFGKVSELYSYKMTPGTTIRSEAVRVLRAKFE